MIIKSPQQRYIKKYTDIGFIKQKLDKDIFNIIRETWDENWKGFPIDEKNGEFYNPIIKRVDNNRVGSYTIKSSDLNSSLHYNLKEIHENFFWN